MVGRGGSTAVDDTRRRTRAVVGVVLTGCVFLVVLLAASSSGTPVFVAGRGSATPTPSATPTSIPAPVPTGLLRVRASGTASGFAALGILGIAFAAIFLILAIGILAVAGRSAFSTFRSRNAVRTANALRDVVDGGSTRADAVGRALADLQRAVVEGSPRAGIVAAWVRLEQLAADSGVPLRLSETPAELTIRVLDGLDVPGRYVLRLADLYREARFSDHRMTEADRSEASRCISAICNVAPSPSAEQLTP